MMMQCCDISVGGVDHGIHGSGDRFKWFVVPFKKLR